jgi:hypothetical protein
LVCAKAPNKPKYNPTTDKQIFFINDFILPVFLAIFFQVMSEVKG